MKVNVTIRNIVHCDCEYCDMCNVQSLETLDNGKPIKDAFRNIQNAANIIRYYAGIADKAVGQTIPSGTVCYSFFKIKIFHRNYFQRFNSASLFSVNTK